MMRMLTRALTTFVLMLCLTTSRAAGQRILDWPVRTSAQPEAVVRGVEAAFWNPAAITTESGHGEVIIADQRTPDLIGINGLAAAGSWRLDTRTVIAGGFQHVSIDDIGETSTSPLPDAADPTFSIAEDQLAAGVSHVLGAALRAGAGVRYARSNETGLSESSTSLTAGFVFTPVLPMRPVFGASIATETGDLRYIAAVQVSAPHVARDLDLSAGYGFRGGKGMIATEHRIGINATWRALVAGTLGVATVDAGSGRTWDPVMGVSMRVSRYELGVLREVLSNDFGAAYSFRFRVGMP